MFEFSSFLAGIFGGFIGLGIAALAILFALSFLTNEDRDSSPWISTVCSLLILYFALGSPVFSDPLSLVLLIVAYIFVGIAWSFFSHDRFVVRFLDGKEGRELTGYEARQIEAKNCKSRIGYDVIFWPISSISYIAYHFAADLVDKIVSTFGGIYDRKMKAYIKKNNR